MRKFSDSLKPWNTESFNRALRSDIESLESGALPLEKCVFQGGYIDDSNVTVTVLGATDDEESIQARVGVFFTEIVACCGCGDEPMHQNAYGEILIRIDKQTAEVDLDVVSDQS